MLVGSAGGARKTVYHLPERGHRRMPLCGLRFDEPGSQDIKVVESYQAGDNINASIQNANLPVSG